MSITPSEAQLARQTLHLTPTPAAAKGKSTGPTKPAPPPHVTDLRAKIAQMKLKEGTNVIHTEAGVKLMAEVKGGKVVGYNATDVNGKALSGQITLTMAVAMPEAAPTHPTDPTSAPFACEYPSMVGQDCIAIPCPW